MSSSSSTLVDLANVVSTGEVPWVHEMINKYHDTAKTNGAIVSSALPGFNASNYTYVFLPCKFLLLEFLELVVDLPRSQKYSVVLFTFVGPHLQRPVWLQRILPSTNEACR